VRIAISGDDWAMNTQLGVLEARDDAVPNDDGTQAKYGDIDDG